MQMSETNISTDQEVAKVIQRLNVQLQHRPMPVPCRLGVLLPDVEA